MADEPNDDYTITNRDPNREIPAPELPYQPRDPKAYRPKIGLIACGGITKHHLTAYQGAGYDVAVLCDLHAERAERRREEFYPSAKVTTDFRDVLADPAIEVVDIATHPQERLPLIEAALRAKKHVLSQKPFVTNLDDGERLVALADEMGVRLAVNQNGRWSPHFGYLREAVKAGVIGDLISAHVAVHWDHTWVKGSPFERIYDLVLYDFAIHWFDFLSTVLGDRRVTSVYATRNKTSDQEIEPPLLAQAVIQFDGGQASALFDAGVRYGSQDRTYLGGTKGSLLSTGPDLGAQTVTLSTADGKATPKLVGAWFSDGFHGTMGELLCAIEEGREPSNSARNNLKSLALCYAAIASANDNAPKIPGEVRQLPAGSVPEQTVGVR
jgi:predicted dehydrogenase